LPPDLLGNDLPRSGIVAVSNLSEIHLQGQAEESDRRLEKLIENNELSC
jgi:hypothetical protein